MAETQKQQLIRLLSIIQDYTLDSPPNEIETAFLQLEELDRSKNLPLWINLKTFLHQNKALHGTDVLKYITNLANSKAGYWWYDPRKWLL